MYPYFVSKIFINHNIIINKSCQTCPAHIVKWHNAKTGVTATLLTIIFEPKKARFTSARHVLSYVITTTRAQIKIKYFFIPDTLAVRLLSVSVSVVILANNALRAHHASAHGGVSTNGLLNICLNVF